MGGRRYPRLRSAIALNSSLSSFRAYGKRIRMVIVLAAGKLPEREPEWRDELNLGWRYENKTAIADKGKAKESSESVDLKNSTRIDTRSQKPVELEDRADADVGDNTVNAQEARSPLAPYVYNPANYRTELPMPVKLEDGTNAKGQV